MESFFSKFEVLDGGRYTLSFLQEIKGEPVPVEISVDPKSDVTEFWKEYANAELDDTISLSEVTELNSTPLFFDFTLEKGNKVNIIKEVLENVAEKVSKPNVDFIGVHDFHKIAFILDSTNRSSFRIHFPYIRLSNFNRSLFHNYLSLKIPELMNYSESWICYGTFDDNHLGILSFDGDVRLGSAQVRDWKKGFSFDLTFISHPDLNDLNPNAFNGSLPVPMILSLNFNHLYESGLDLSPPKPKMQIGSSKTEKFKRLEGFLVKIGRERWLSQNSWLEISDAIEFETRSATSPVAGLDIFRRMTLEHLKDSSPPRWMTGTSSFENETYSIFTRIRKNDGRFTERTLAWYASKDSKKMYQAWHEDWVTEAFEEAFSSFEDIPLGDMFYRMFWLNLFYVPEGRGSWFYFDEKKHRLVEDVGEKEILKFYEKFVERFAQLLTHKEETKESVRYVTKLKNSKMRQQIINAPKHRFTVVGFSKFLDSSIEIMGIGNGVLHMTGSGTITVQEGKPEDYVFNSLNANYDDSLTENHPRVKELLIWWGKVFKNEEGRSLDEISDPERNGYLKYVLKTFSSILYRKNLYKHMIFLKGGMNNGKSMLIKLFEQLFKGNLVKSDPSLITVKHGQTSSGPSPETFRLKNKAITVIDEIGAGHWVDGNKVKRGTGNDGFFARDLHQSGEDIVGTAKYYATTNTMPRFMYADSATVKRILIFPCVASFLTVSECPVTEEDQIKNNIYRMDEDFDDKIPQLLPGFLWLLIKYFPLIRERGGLRENIPKEIIQETEKYWSDNDVYYLFAKENLEVGAKSDRWINSADLFLTFRNWYRETCPNSKCPDIINFKESISRIIGEQVDFRGWNNVKIAGQVVKPQGKEPLIESAKTVPAVPAGGMFKF